MGGDDDKPDFACRCLNVRIHRRQPGPDVDPQTPSSSEPGYEPLFVGEDGVVVRHNQLTIRTRATIATDPSTSRRTQRTFVTCLVCTITVYCITTEVAQDADAKPGPILPTEDWVEGETLTSKTGWIEVHVASHGCIDAKEIERITSSPSYSQYFSVDLASAPHGETNSHWAPTSARLSIPSSYSFLPPLPAFLPPPPFTPSHPIFNHLSACVKVASDRARAYAEQRVYELAKQQLAELDAHESELRGQLETLWRTVREELRKYEKERDEGLLTSWQTRRRSMSPRGRSSSFAGTPAVIREFVPSTYSGQRMSRPSAPRQSALSASLATSAFHHPKAQQGEASATPVNESRNALPSPPPYVSNPSSPTRSVGSATSDSEAGMPMSLKRNMNETIDAAATYRWYVIEEQEAERRKVKERIAKGERKEAGKASDEKPREKDSIKANDIGGSEVSKETKVHKEISDEASTVDSKQSKSDGKKGKRHVSFKSEPAVVTIKREVNDEKDELPLEGAEELIFNIDDTDRLEGNGEDTSPEKLQQAQALTLPLMENSQESHSGRIKRRATDLSSAGLPQSFAALRPSSLPAPSNVRPPIRSIMNGKRKSNVDTSGKNTRGIRIERGVGGLRSSTGSSEKSFVPYQAELLKLVAADTPSHRGSWNRDSESWKIFDRKRESQSQKLSVSEEDETDDSATSSADNGVAIGMPNGSTLNNWSNYKLPGLPSSVPVAMTPVSQLQLSSNGRSLQPKTSLTERRGTLVPPLPVVREEDGERVKKSPSAIRKATYIARDRLRAMDPGVLDFLEEEDEEDGTDSPMSQDSANQVSASRGRQHALKILRAGSSVPDAGAWRSLA